MSFNLSYLESEIQDQYLHDESKRPWIIGFSGGKDSTMLLQTVWNAIAKIEPALRNRHIYVICNDTLVENPRIVKYVKNVLKKIQKSATEQDMPITVHETTPRLEDTFWVNLIGKGYPAPNNMFRWCTERLKINPTTRFIIDKIGENGEVIILLGTRSAESANRAKSIKKYGRKGQRLRKHILPNAYVFAAIKDVTNNELWQYLMQISCPWGGTNKELITLYKNANSGDCPLVIDDTTPSCGNSRFGCWVCTVVKRDKSMEGLIDSGEDWMYPLMELRDSLVETRNDRDAREKRRRGSKKIVGDNEEEWDWGPYVPKYRAKFLKKILEAQKEIQEDQGEIELITHQELVAIQLSWYRDSIFNFKVSDIYNDIYNKGIDMSEQNERIRKEESLLKKSCGKNKKDFTLIQDLLKLQKTKTLMVKKRGLQNDIENRIETFLESK